MRITRFERYKYIMKKLSCYDLLRQGQQNCEIGTNFFSVPNIFDSSSKTFSGTKFFRYRFRDFFPVLNFSDTGSDTFFRYQIFPIPVPILFSGTKLFRYRFRYHQKKEKFPIPGIPGTGTSNSAVETVGLPTTLHLGGGRNQLFRGETDSKHVSVKKIEWRRAG